ncbi:hypothetical protein SLEP1_g56187 [Rubroshorea leprosula]|uniref:Uncharacterized protein n=1 Tax=Rubroshorea leprosula TaxID=152421 RepID=A0AAV5MLX9_9ROSI|nr:hypothetical protein SLEP1_g56187 [Rubroshorea leprosula]
MLGELVGEVVRIHEDTTNKIILGDGRVLILCSKKSKIFRTVNLKVEDQMYEVGMIEEEWRSDPDWWLSNGDRWCESETESEYSLMPNGSEDADLIHVAKSGGNEDIFDKEMLEKEADSNSNGDFVTNGSDSMLFETEDIKDGHSEPNECNGLVRDKRIGLDEAYGPDAKLSPKKARDSNDIWPAAAHEHVLTPVQSLENRGATGKRRKHILECYPQNLVEIGDKSTQWVMARTKQRQHRWKQAQQEALMKVGESISLSDGCIVNRNQVIQREMNLLEVRRMISVGKRLGVKIQGTEEEVQSRLLQLEEPEVVKEQGEFAGDGFLGIDGVWGSKKVLCHFVNVYTPQDRYKKVRLWEELGNMVMEKGGRWMIAGDFTAVRCPEERRGRTGECPEMEEFNVFIETSGLVDIRLTNKRFTWYRPDGSSVSWLDRFLMTEEMYSLGCEWVQQGLKRTVSDHCAVILKTSKWRELEVEGYAGYRCKQKLKLLKEFLKGWNRDVFGDVEAQLAKATAMVEKIDKRNEDFELEEFEVSQRQEGVQEIWDVLSKKEAIWRQKSRCNWAQLGDVNTRFFHNTANGKRAQNNILGLSCDGRWVEEPKLVKREVAKYFSALFQCEC